MSTDLKACPVCGESIRATARKCRFCGEYFDPADRPPPPPPDAVERMLLPVGRPASAIAAGYLGLFAFFPLIGIVAGILAVLLGLRALKTLQKNPELSGAGRAWFGIIAGGLMALLQISIFVIVLAIDLAHHR
jgi:hypothetical protein